MTYLVSRQNTKFTFSNEKRYFNRPTFAKDFEQTLFTTLLNMGYVQKSTYNNGCKRTTYFYHPRWEQVEKVDFIIID